MHSTRGVSNDLACASAGLLLNFDRYHYGGCDLHPLDPSDANDADTLLGFIWPDQPVRFNRLRAALEIARAHRMEIVRADGIAWPRTAALPSEGGTTALLHTVISEHMAPPEPESPGEAIDELAARATGTRPLAWIRMEPAQQGYRSLLTHWPGARETVIAVSDGHAQNLRWNP